MNVIQAQLGHSNLGTTSRYLAHIAPAEVIRVMQGREWEWEWEWEATARDSAAYCDDEQYHASLDHVTSQMSTSGDSTRYSRSERRSSVRAARQSLFVGPGAMHRYPRSL